MPIPRFQPARIKRLKTSQPTAITNGPSLDSLDDYCLSKIIGYALSNASSSDDYFNASDTRIVEKNLSLVSRRWYWLTQTQVGLHGVCRINLNRLATRGTKQITADSWQNTYKLQNIDLFRRLLPKLLKYKHIQLEGSLTCAEFKKIVVALDAARTERLSLKVNIEKDGTLAKHFSILPKQLVHLKELILIWFNDSDKDYSNVLTWTLYMRATNLETLEIYLQEPETDSFDNQVDQEFLNDRLKSFQKKLDNLNISMDSIPVQSLKRLVFNRSLSDSPTNCTFTSLIKSTLTRENCLSRVDTNDTSVIEYLIKSSNRICTARKLESLKLLSPIKNMELLSELLTSRILGTKYLSIVIDNIDQIEEVRHSMEMFNISRNGKAICQLSLHLRDQKFSDCEDKIKHLVHLSRLAKVMICVSAQQRVSIDCCHLMWSIGRALQSSDLPGECLFNITIHQCLMSRHSPSKLGKSKQAGNSSEITIPFGGFKNHHKINPNTEDVNRHREILKAVKKNCYNSFVKSVRDNVLSR